jgi:predicted TIM-barrel fold metal-dependent hydrolase
VDSTSTARDDGLLIVDSDTHLTEPWDLWTSRAPAALVDRVPQVRAVDDKLRWVVDDLPLGPAGAVCVVDPTGIKHLGSEYAFRQQVQDVHPGASQVTPRLALMDQQGVWAQLVYPNTVGFGGQQLGKVADLPLRNACAEIYNNAMADIQAESGNRLFPMAVMPWWDVDSCIREIARVKEMGLVGVNITPDPQEHGLPDLSTEYWTPLFSALEDYDMPLNFHIGASATQSTYHGTAPWPTRDSDEKLAIGSAMVFLSNGRVIANIIYGGILERHPRLRVASVESGVGWLPFFLQALDYQLDDTAPRLRKRLSLRPSEFFRRQMAACFWFENDLLIPSIEWLGVDNCLFETDFPHPTCLYPDPVTRALAVFEDVDETFRRKAFGENAVRFYSLPVPEMSTSR